MPDINTGRIIIPSANKRSRFEELGVPGLKISGGLIDEEFYPRLKGLNGVRIYREMADNSSTIGAIRFIIRSLVSQVDWRTEAAQVPGDAALEVAAFVDECIEDMDHTFESFISEVLSFLDYGWAYFETTYKIRRGKTKDKKLNSKFDDGKIGWRKFGLRAQDTLDQWEFAEEDLSLLGMWQYDSYSGRRAFIPIEKAILFRTETLKDNPEGRSIYRNAVLDYYFLKKICEIEAIGIERDMTGLLTMEVPLELLMSNASDGAKVLRAQLEKMLSELKRDEREYAMVPTEIDKEGKSTGYKMKLLSSGGTRQIDTTKVKQDYKTSILQSVMSQFIQLGVSGAGSFALASSQTDLFAVAIGNFLDIIESTFNQHALAPLMEANNVDPELWPKIKHGDIESAPLAEIGTYIQQLASAGMLPVDDNIQNKLLELADLPQPEDNGSVEKGCGCSVPAEKKRKIRLPRVVKVK